MLLAAAAGVAGCGRETPATDPQGPQGSALVAPQRAEPENLGFPERATKNTTRIPGANSTELAAAVARAVFPDPQRRPDAVTLVDGSDWRVAVAAAALMAPPFKAPILFSDGTRSAGPLERRARGAGAHGRRRRRQRAGHPRRRGRAARGPEGHATSPGSTPLALTRGIAALLRSARPGRTSRVIVASSEDASYAAPAAAYAAKSGVPVLFVTKDRVPPETRAALAAFAGLTRPRIFILGPSSVVSPSVTRQLRSFGRVERYGGKDPIANALGVARYRNGAFGWGVVDPGHGLVFARAGRPLDAVAAAPLSATGKFGPLLLLDDAPAPAADRPAVPARHPAGLQHRPRDRGLQSRLDHRQHEGDLRGPAIPHRRPAGDHPGSHAGLAAHTMSQAEHPDRLRPDHQVTLDDVRQLMGASTPHFALQLRNRIAKLIRGLPADHPARIEGEREIARLTALGLDGELRGHAAEPGMRTLASVSGDAAAAGHRRTERRRAAHGRMADPTSLPAGIQGSRLPGPFAVGTYAAKLREYLRERSRVQLHRRGLEPGSARATGLLRAARRRGALPCSMWRTDFEALRLGGGALADGSQVVVARRARLLRGSRTSSPAFSFAVDRLRVAGEGDLLAQLDRLRKALDAEGLFEPQKLLARPALPRTIGVVTGEGGKARDDVLAGLRRRGWAGRIVWAFAPVQDRHAAPRITRARCRTSRRPGGVDVIVVARGGGSMADLSASATRRCAGPSRCSACRSSPPSATTPIARSSTTSPR